MRHIHTYVYICLCVCVCVWDRERERERDMQTSGRRQRVFMVWFPLFIGISTFHGLFNAKTIRIEGHLCYYLIHNLGDKGLITFPTPKVNLIVELEFELSSYDVAVWTCQPKCLRMCIDSMPMLTLFIRKLFCATWLHVLQFIVDCLFAY